MKKKRIGGRCVEKALDHESYGPAVCVWRDATLGGRASRRAVDFALGAARQEIRPPEIRPPGYVIDERINAMKTKTTVEWAVWAVCESSK